MEVCFPERCASGSRGIVGATQKSHGHLRLEQRRHNRDNNGGQNAYGPLQSYEQGLPSYCHRHRQFRTHLRPKQEGKNHLRRSGVPESQVLLERTGTHALISELTLIVIQIQ